MGFETTALLLVTILGLQCCHHRLRPNRNREDLHHGGFCWSWWPAPILPTLMHWYRMQFLL